MRLKFGKYVIGNSVVITEIIKSTFNTFCLKLEKLTQFKIPMTSIVKQKELLFMKRRKYSRVTNKIILKGPQIPSC